MDISAGSNYVLALDKNGHVWGWGSNLTKQIHPSNTFVKNALTDIDGEIIRPYKIADLCKINVVQIFAFDDVSLAITKDKRILIWGDSKNEILGKNNNPENIEKNPGILDKKNIKNYIEKELLKDNSDITEQFVISRRIFNTKYNQIIQDSKDSKNDNENVGSLNKKSANDTPKDVFKNNNQKDNAKNTKTDKNLDILGERIKDFDKKLEELNIKKDGLRTSLKVIDDDINQFKIDQDKINKKLNDIKFQGEQNFNKKHLIQSKIKKLNDPKFKAEIISINNQKNSQINPPDQKYNTKVISTNKLVEFIKEEHEKSLSSQIEEKSETVEKLEIELREAIKNIQNMQIYEESFNNSLLKIKFSLDQKNVERSNISNQILKIIEYENENLKNKVTLDDVRTIVKEYDIKVEKNSIKNDRYEIFNSYINRNKNIDDSTFYSFYKKDVLLGAHKCATELLKESNESLFKVGKEFDDSLKNLNESEIFSISILCEIMRNKITMIVEQNNLIKYINIMLINMGDDLINYYEAKFLIDNVNEGGNEVKSMSFLDKLRKNPINNKRTEKMNMYCKLMIINFLKEAYNMDEINDTQALKKNKLNWAKKFTIFQSKDDKEAEINNDLFMKDVEELRSSDIKLFNKRDDD